MTGLEEQIFKAVAKLQPASETAIAAEIGEGFHPEIIAAFLRSWNDCLPTNADRDRLLKPLVLRLIDTRFTAAVEERRSYMALDWLIRVHTPKWLDLVPSLAPHAKALRDLEEIVDMAGATAAEQFTDAAWDAAWAAARAAAGNFCARRPNGCKRLRLNWSIA